MLENIKFVTEQVFSKNKELFHIDIAKKVFNDRELRTSLKGIFKDEGLKMKRPHFKELITDEEGMYEGFSLSFDLKDNNINVNQASVDVCWYWWAKEKIIVMSKMNNEIVSETKNAYAREDYINGGSDVFRNDVKGVIKALRMSLEEKGTSEAIIP